MQMTAIMSIGAVKSPVTFKVVPWVKLLIKINRYICTFPGPYLFSSKCIPNEYLMVLLQVVVWSTKYPS